MFKVDLYSCLLFIIGKIYECSHREVIIPIILPLFKALVKALTESEDEKKYCVTRNILRVNKRCYLS